MEISYHNRRHRHRRRRDHTEPTPKLILFDLSRISIWFTPLS